MRNPLQKLRYVHQNHSFNGWLVSLGSHAVATIQMSHSQGIREWRVSPKTTTYGSKDQAFEERQYDRSMQIHKECFDALFNFA